MIALLLPLHNNLDAGGGGGGPTHHDAPEERFMCCPPESRVLAVPGELRGLVAEAPDVREAA